MNHIGIDLGGTKTEAILLDDDFNILDRKRIPTVDDYSGIVSSIKKLTDEIRQGECDVGVCAPGAISETGLVKNSNTACLRGMPLKKDLEKHLRCEIRMDNDANCFALAEARIGAAQGFGTVFGIIMGTGVGGGIIIDGMIRHGRLNIAGEWGHHILDKDGHECYCGRRGCVETCISGPALERRWRELTGRNDSLKSIPDNLESDGAMLWKGKFLRDFGTGVANVIDILDPDAIVLGGGVSNIGFLYDEGQDAIYERVFSDSVDTPILRNKLGDSAGVFGACMLW